MGKKSLQNLGQKSRPYWGFVEMVSTNVDDVKNALKEGNIGHSLIGMTFIRCDFYIYITNFALQRNMILRPEDTAENLLQEQPGKESIAF